MKVDRILEMIIYLLNHDRVPASYLASRFHVSVRTVQRDMVCISNIGIPLYSSGGKNGGYSILKHYTLKNAEIREEEQQLIMHALESLATSYSNDALNALIEKYNAIVEKEGGQKIFWDFSVTKENVKVQDLNRRLEEAIRGRHYIRFGYKNAQGKRTEQYVEPLAIHYKWYAWYLFAYAPEREQYRTFKVARMNGLTVEEERSETVHEEVKVLMERSERAYYDTCIEIEVQFSEEERELIEEYFPDCPIDRIADGAYLVRIRVPARERLWKALLLSFGDRVKVLSPEDYRRELVETAQKFLSNYDI